MPEKENAPVPDVIALRPFVPAKDFEISLSFLPTSAFTPIGCQLASMHRIVRLPAARKTE
jgi:hypothetical protein